MTQIAVYLSTSLQSFLKIKVWLYYFFYKCQLKESYASIVTKRKSEKEIMISGLEHSFYKEGKEGHMDVQSGHDSMFTLSL